MRFIMILSCNNISKSFDGKNILDECSFHIEDHEKAAIVGINGAGKSTFLNTASGEKISIVSSIPQTVSIMLITITSFLPQ